MKLTEEDKKNIMECLLNNISHISDKDYQKRVWIRGEGPEASDFDETVCNFFQEGDGVIEKYKDFGLTKNQFRLLENFRTQFEKFSDKHFSPQLFIDTLEWTKITLMAKEVLRAFNYQQKDNVKNKAE